MQGLPLTTDIKHHSSNTHLWQLFVVAAVVVVAVVAVVAVVVAVYTRGNS